MLSIIIPNYNGKEFLEQCLDSIINSVASVDKKNNNPPTTDHRSLITEIIIVDNGSTDGSVELIKSLTSSRVNEWLKKKEKNNNNNKSNSLITNSLIKNRKITIKLIENKKNLGFIYSCNRGVKEAKGEFVVLLNNDVIPEKGFLEPALKHFEDPKVFAVSFNEQQFGWAKIWWRGGFIHHGVGGAGKKPHISAWASGGSAVYRKSIWQKLGGFDPLYHPFYWEDFDLGYRAWKAGYQIIWEPQAVVHHRHETTISKIDRNYVNLINIRGYLELSIMLCRIT